MNHLQDKKIQKLALQLIEKASMSHELWGYTIIGEVHSKIINKQILLEGELPIVSSYISEKSWYLMTTRKIYGFYNNSKTELSPLEIKQYDFGNFKSNKNLTNTVTFITKDDIIYELEYEVFYASMAPIHYLRFFEFKYPILDKLRA